MRRFMTSCQGRNNTELFASLLYSFLRISDYLLIQRNKKVEAQPRPSYSSELVFGLCWVEVICETPNQF